MLEAVFGKIHPVLLLRSTTSVLPARLLSASSDVPTELADPYEPPKKKCFLCKNNVDLDYKAGKGMCGGLLGVASATRKLAVCAACDSAFLPTGTVAPIDFFCLQRMVAAEQSSGPCTSRQGTTVIATASCCIKVVQATLSFLALHLGYLSLSILRTSASTLRPSDIGPDAIPTKLLKELASEMSKPLALIFQTSFVTGCLPSDWKSATITPLFKGGSRASANNYRPVSLTSICCKIMEKIIKKALVQFLEQHHLLSDAQHGFRSGRSCLTNLLFTLERWTKARDEGKVVHAIYIDFKKAFDSVPHQRLLYKLRNAGIRGRLLVWIQSFLAGRSQ
nr:unnamed protein product [Spirometra erinaceieuropaei]